MLKLLKIGFRVSKAWGKENINCLECCEKRFMGEWIINLYSKNNCGLRPNRRKIPIFWYKTKLALEAGDGVITSGDCQQEIITRENAPVFRAWYFTDFEDFQSFDLKLAAHSCLL